MNKLNQVVNQKQTQEMVIKPKMLQSLEMLAMPLMELELHLKHELVNNPMLELKEIEDDEEEKDKANDEEEKENSDEEENEDEELEETLDEAEELSEILDSWNEYHKGGKSSSSGSSDDDQARPEALARQIENKKTKYTDQLEKYELTIDEFDFAVELIDSANNHGYLPQHLDIAEVGKQYDFSPEHSEELHDIILHLYPKGITARDIEECLLAQLNHNELKNTTLVDLIKFHFDDLIHRRYNKIAAQLNITVDRVLKIKNEIAHLDPKPGLRILNSNKEYIVPDVVIKRIGDEYEVIVNDYYIPNIVLNRRYEKIVKSNKKDKNALKYVRNKINSAKFLIKSIYMRNKTLEKVTRAIIKHQKEYFYENKGVLKPLTYSAIAEELSVNESTISRVVKVKYADTPFGIKCLKEFFTSRAGKDRNYSPVSRQNVQQQIKKMIDNEDKSNPLSDQKIANILKERGISVSRRVIAKYRENLRILNSRLRRKEWKEK